MHDMVRVVLLGAGKGGLAVLNRLLRFDWVQIVGVLDRDDHAPAVRMARESGLPVYIGDPFEILRGIEADLVFELTGNHKVQGRLQKMQPKPFDTVAGPVAFFMWSMIQELEDQEDRLKEYLQEHRTLAKISLMLSRSETTDEIFQAIVSGGMQITGMPAGSLSIFNKEKEELFLAAAKGFSSEFYKNAVYPIRSGGLTEHILSQSEPVLIAKVEDHPAFNNPILIKEGIRSLIAVPLISHQEPVGILYTDDFKPRTFNPSMIETLKLLALQAVIAIQKQQAFEQIKHLSIRDPLTSLYNRRYLNDILLTEADRAVRLRRPLSIILVDIDHFKTINDRHGHLTGDQVLRDLAQVFVPIVRPYDTLARFGGEEFLLLMPEALEDEALAVAARMQRAVLSSRILPHNERLTCSFGICTWKGEDSDSPLTDLLIQRADQALYQAKDQGRNRIYFFGLDQCFSVAETTRHSDRAAALPKKKSN